MMYTFLISTTTGLHGAISQKAAILISNLPHSCYIHRLFYPPLFYHTDDVRGFHDDEYDAGIVLGFGAGIFRRSMQRFGEIYCAHLQG